MSLITRYLILIILLTCQPVSLLSQNARQYFRTGLEFSQAGNHRDAIDQFTRAIDMDPQYVQAYVERASSYESGGELQNAADDLRRALTFEEKDPGIYFNAARIQFILGNYNDALPLVNKCISQDRKSDAAHRLLARIQMALEDYSGSLASINKALELKENADNFFYRGQLSEIMKNDAQAESDYKNAISENEKYTAAYLAMALLKLRTNKPAEAIRNCDAILALNTFNKDALIVRGRAYANLKQYPEAIDDVSKVLSSEPENKVMYFTRGTYYQDFTQHQAAINDFSKVLLLDPGFSEAIYRRAYSYEQTGDFKSAIKDYEKLTELSASDLTAQRHLDEARQRLFELNRESDPPKLILLEPEPASDSTLRIPGNLRTIRLRGRITDASELSQVLINKKPAVLFRKEDSYEFSADADISLTDIITIQARDVYDNHKSSVYTLTRTETGAPKVAIMAPYASDNGEIYLDSDSPNLYLEGRITDESVIQSILIDGVTASFAVNELNPSFTATIQVANKNGFHVTATDIFGNDTTIAYILNREGVSMLEQNPMGKTWVVFVENSNYETFPSLDGPSKDILLMRSALAGYDIHKIIHKQDMTKKEMERFFSIELRDLLKSNKVNSLMIWYAGHGKYYNETGYWVPSDGRREDEFTYYNLNALRASLQSYSSYVTHNLVISDACESGATFNQAVREIPGEKNCSDWETIKFKSAQAFTSAGYEIAADQSQFTKTFASVLSHNPNACLPIETVVSKVTEAVKQTSSQNPKFGKISGLVDEGGTFFFMSKNR